MACFIISYDLPAGSDYETLISAIKAYGTWAHITKSTWAIVTEADANTIRDELDELVPDGSRIFVVKSGVRAAWRNVMCSSVWLKRNL